MPQFHSDTNSNANLSEEDYIAQELKSVVVEDVKSKL